MVKDAEAVNESSSSKARVNRVRIVVTYPYSRSLSLRMDTPIDKNTFIPKHQANLAFPVREQ